MIEIDQSALDAMVEQDPTGPVVMLNLLRFKPGDGEEKYQRYLRALQPAILRRYGMQIEYAGRAEPALASSGAVEWDMVTLVRYPHRKAFLDLIQDPEYQAVSHLLDEALAGGVLQPTTPGDAADSGTKNSAGALDPPSQGSR